MGKTVSMGWEVVVVGGDGVIVVVGKFLGYVIVDEEHEFRKCGFANPSLSSKSLTNPYA